MAANVPMMDIGSARLGIDRKSTRLNSSHLVISYAVFCLKKKEEVKPLVAVGGAPALLASRERCDAVVPAPTSCDLVRRAGYNITIAYYFFYFFFNDTATTEIYTLSLHDALPI